MTTKSMRVGPLGLGLGHLLVVAVGALRIDEEVGAGSPWSLAGSEEKAPATISGLAVHVRGDAVHRADEGAASAADHAITKFAIESHGRGIRD
jgi:hypothetical protein